LKGNNSDDVALLMFLNKKSDNAVYPNYSLKESLRTVAKIGVDGGETR
jgi:hypothetical protein